MIEKKTVYMLEGKQYETKEAAQEEVFRGKVSKWIYPDEKDTKYLLHLEEIVHAMKHRPEVLGEMMLELEKDDA